MEIEQQLFVLSIGVLVVTASIYGMKFLGKGNYLLGIEWLVIALSGASIVVFALGDVDAAYHVAYFCDAFSRGCGGPLITILGLMAVTHGYRPLPCFDLYLFGGAAAGTAALVEADAAAPLRPMFYLCMWGILSLYLVYFIWRLAGVRAYRHALGVGVVLVSAQAIAGMYDFYTLPGDEERVLFYILAAPVWSFLCMEMYYAYCALERAAPEAVPDGVGIDELELLF
ncbi:hypothetical protein [Massilia putida]|uniref:hypothetical protein n=1 Tax=Massilia putida TaxID=1141883 RepID=UPI0009520179|nr:hypothetical protein [Massilia putida]